MTDGEDHARAISAKRSKGISTREETHERTADLHAKAAKLQAEQCSALSRGGHEEATALRAERLADEERRLAKKERRSTEKEKPSAQPQRDAQ
jgi:hypothetical protein